MPITVRKGKGTLLKRNGVSVPGVTNLKPGGVSNPKMEVTDLDSTWVETDSTLPEGTPITFDLNWDPDNVVHQNIRADCVSGDSNSWTIVVPARAGQTARTYSFTGRVESFDQGATDAKGMHKVSCSITPTGAVTIA